jgi:glycosyltransferase involved in cell wall biosynthesis
MGKTLGLSIIVKDEEHVIERMLETIYPILDFYTVVDTGSTDNTKKVIKDFFDKKGIKGQILDRPFDNFENSRNYAMSEAKPHTDYCIWIDADEELIIDKTFNKDKLNKDLYMVNTRIGSMKYTRNEIWSNKKDFKWYGPVHEYIIPSNNQEITSDVAEGLLVNVHMDGASWQKDTSQKYKKHANLLEDYLITDRNPRWVFYTGQSWHDSASTKSKVENDERLRRSLNYFKERVTMNDGYPEERFYAQYRVGVICKMLERPWSETKRELLKAYSIDPLRGESIKTIIEYYQKIGEWGLAFLYSSFAYGKFHNQNPYPKRLLFVEETIYRWKFLELHMNSLFYMKDIPQTKKLAKELLNILRKDPSLFKDDEKKRISNNVNKILSAK